VVKQRYLQVAENKLSNFSVNVNANGQHCSTGPEQLFQQDIHIWFTGKDAARPMLPCTGGLHGPGLKSVASSYAYETERVWVMEFFTLRRAAACSLQIYIPSPLWDLLSLPLVLVDNP
jgi:hypothetical protein